MTKNVSTIIGKTIKSINTESCNAWKITFTDGTEKVLWAENSGSYGFGDLYLDDDIFGPHRHLHVVLHQQHRNFVFLLHPPDQRDQFQIGLTDPFHFG